LPDEYLSYYLLLAVVGCWSVGPPCWPTKSPTLSADKMTTDIVGQPCGSALTLHYITCGNL